MRIMQFIVMILNIFQAFFFKLIQKDILITQQIKKYVLLQFMVIKILNEWFAYLHFITF